MRTEVVEKRLASLATLSCKGRRINGLHRLLGCPRLWEQAYETIAPNKGALTPGVDPDNTLDGFSLERMERIISKVKDGSYRFQPARRVYIPKPNGKKRPLGIPNADDKLVQAAVKLVLEQIYEPVFSKNSHGFRMGHSCHTALAQVLRTWTGVNWLVDMDVVGFFDNIDHSILINLLRKRINDEKFLRLIKGMLAAGYMEDWKWHATFSGTPQGGVISPLLANIYLHELDVFMDKFQTRFRRGKGRRQLSEYAQKSDALYRTRRKITKLRSTGRETEAQELVKYVRVLRADIANSQCRDAFDPTYRRLQYVRYADDFLIGVIGPKQDAREIMTEVRAFLKDTLKLEISDEKSGIAHGHEGVDFLGYTVSTTSVSHAMRFTRLVPQGKKATSENGDAEAPKTQTVNQRAPSGRIILRAPRTKLAAFVERQRLGNYHTIRSEHRSEVENNSDIEILTLYNAIMRGLAEYYSLGSVWKTDLSPVHHVWWFSLMKTLANKHKCSVAKVCRTVLTVH